jgi:hypothetical protein
MPWRRLAENHCGTFERSNQPVDDRSQTGWWYGGNTNYCKTIQRFGLLWIATEKCLRGTASAGNRCGKLPCSEFIAMNCRFPWQNSVVSQTNSPQINPPQTNSSHCFVMNDFVVKCIAVNWFYGELFYGALWRTATAVNYYRWSALWFILLLSCCESGAMNLPCGEYHKWFSAGHYSKTIHRRVVHRK